MWQLIKEWFGRDGADVGSVSIDVEAVLENLKSDPNSNDALSGMFALNGLTVELRIVSDGRTLAESIETARKLLINFQEMHGKALSVASDKLLLNYNENWREYSERLDDGSYEDVSRPMLDRSTFEASIQISSVSVIGSMLEFMYSDEDLFHGHSIVVSSFDSLNFSDTHVELFG